MNIKGAFCCSSVDMENDKIQESNLRNARENVKVDISQLNMFRNLQSAFETYLTDFYHIQDITNIALLRKMK